ncbi:MAG: cystathionine gamma-synthase [Gemmatimonadetes bacterium]|nr:cystathionine gamma-synthase [Gemmatimonadota bacterium]
MSPRAKEAGNHAATRSVRAAIGTDTSHRAVVPPLHLSANFVFDAPGSCGRYDYTRSGNPTRDHLQEAVADAEGGSSCVITASGMAAVTVITQLLRPGDVLLAPHDCYGGCHRLFTAESRRIGFDVHFVDQSTDAAVELARACRPRIIWLETPSNPLLRIVDLARWVGVAREVGALTVADNTFLSPANQRPLEWGIDLVVHSTTKFINGHSDVVGGAVVSRDAALGEELAWWTNCIGVSGSPFDAYLTLRGLRTLHARTAIHEQNALAIVDVLGGHVAVAAVHHPSLLGHPGHDIATRQQTGWGSLVSFDLHGGRPAVDAFLSTLQYFTLAESLGGVESLVAHPATMTHASMDDEARRIAGIGEGLLRLSVGIEHAGDLVDDVHAALDVVEERLCVPC